MLTCMADIMRPTFELDMVFGVEDTLRRLRAVIEQGPHPNRESRIVGQTAGQHLTMTVHQEDRHFWSPWLSVHVYLSESEGATENDVKVWGRFSPHPRVWSAYLLGYVALAAIGMISFGWGLSQWSLDKPPVMLIGTGAAVLVAGVMLWSARVGQSLARKQMRHIYREICTSLGVDPEQIGSE